MLHNNKFNVLIVDDEAEDLKLMAKILKKEGYRIFTANSGVEGLALLDKEKIQIVLLDILMPNMTGYHACKEIRKKFKKNPIQIVLVSGLTMDHFLEQAIEVGGDDFIYKPINITELQRRIKAAGLRLKNQMKMFNENKKLEKVVAETEQQSSQIAKEKDDILRKNFELADTNEELKKIVIYDPLSGLYTRKELFAKIDFEIQQANETGQSLIGIMIDVDHFKKINDTYGHHVGDIVITELGKKLRSCLRGPDHAGRYGGEEFFVVLADLRPIQGHTIGERFRKKLEMYEIQYKNHKIRVTVSMGIAQYHPQETRDSWIERADKAMYKAKHLGRNCIVFDETDFENKAG